MPRISPYCVVLTPDEERELKRRAAKYTLPYLKVIRAKIILLAAQGLGNDEIAAKLDTRREVVSMWRKRFFEDRLEELGNALDRVALGLFSPDLIVQMKAIACEFPAVYRVPTSRWSPADKARYACQSGLVVTLSGSTVWRWLNMDLLIGVLGL